MSLVPEVCLPCKFIWHVMSHHLQVLSVQSNAILFIRSRQLAVKFPVSSRCKICILINELWKCSRLNILLLCYLTRFFFLRSYLTRFSSLHILLFKFGLGWLINHSALFVELLKHGRLLKCTALTWEYISLFSLYCFINSHQASLLKVCS